MVDKGYRLPAVIDPPRLCVLLHIPNEPSHIRAFWGALHELTLWHNWERDPEHKGTLVGDVWQDIINADYDVWVHSTVDACGEAIMDCTDLANCIENDPNFLITLQQLVDNSVRNVQPTPNAPMDNARLETNLMPDDVPDGCNRDNVFGIVTALVDGLHQTCVDFLEIIELITDPVEIAGELTDNAGIFTAGASSALDIANWIQDTIRDVYLAKYTSAVRDEIRCALFCNAKEGCSLSINDIFSTYAALAGALTQNFGTFDDAAATIIEIIDEADLIVVCAFHLLIVTILRYGSDFFNLSNFNSLALIMELATNNPDSDHEILCTTCVDLFWEHTGDMLAGLGSYQIVNGVFESGSVKAVTINVDSKLARITFQLTESIKVRGAELDFHTTASGGALNNLARVRLRPIIGSDTGSTFLISQTYNTDAGPRRFCNERTTLQGTFLCREIVVSVQIGSNINFEATSYIDKIRVWGETSPTPPNAAEVPSKPQCTP